MTHSTNSIIMHVSSTTTAHQQQEERHQEKLRSLHSKSKCDCPEYSFEDWVSGCFTIDLAPRWFNSSDCDFRVEAFYGDDS